MTTNAISGSIMNGGGSSYRPRRKVTPAAATTIGTVLHLDEAAMSSGISFSNVSDGLLDNIAIQDDDMTKSSYPDSASSTTSRAMSKYREQQSAQWEVRYRTLLRYRKQYGHCLVPYNWEIDPSLAQWVKRQRYQYRLKMEGKKSTLTLQREAMLSELDFIWDTHEAAWEERRNELIKYKEKYGHCKVPCNYENQTLAIWVKSQRRNNKLLEAGNKTALTLERKQKLDDLDFVWNPPRGTRRRRGQQQQQQNSSRDH